MIFWPSVNKLTFNILHFLLVFTFYAQKNIWIKQKGMHLNHDLSIVVGKQCRTENAWTGRHQYNIFIFKLANVLFIFICFKLVLSFKHSTNIF